jgi:hypothetical protein
MQRQGSGREARFTLPPHGYNWAEGETFRVTVFREHSGGMTSTRDQPGPQWEHVRPMLPRMLWNRQAMRASFRGWNQNKNHCTKFG